MNVTCPECRSIYRIDPAKVPPAGVRARCSVCGGVMSVPGGVQGAAVEAAAPAAVPELAGAGVGSGAPGLASAASGPAAPAWSPVPTPAAPLPAVPPPPPPPAPAPPARPTPSSAAPVIPPHSVDAPAPPPPTVPEHLAFGATAHPTARPTPAHAVPAQPPVAPPPPPPPPPAATPARRPSNPYLANDPNQKARRLARALVSDIVAYHPQKREEALRTGALKQLFRDEIRKSYDEYVEQVGRAMAESTTHFQDALNDVLAGGKKVF